eukprot:comp22899_c0_seq1/m.36213 comp22899_c0_seq1/g.36213  ORF comp22899_c0_seq1/g.36213 comp22899_c0_seq1/m.36213 type:complete len:229 (-) comp22899_c0_seq1:214-900(-)
MPSICPGCNKEISDEEILDKIVEGVRYHLNCFACTKCNEYLGNGQKFFRDPATQGLLCGRCKPTPTPADTKQPGYQVHKPTIQTEAAMCAKCGKGVFSAEKIRAFEKNWHKNCFKCAQCDAVLSAANAHSVDGNAHCLTCYRALELGIKYSQKQDEEAAKQEVSPAQATLDALQGDKEALKKAGFDVANLERYLSEPDFYKAFTMTKAQFDALPAWKKTDLKKKAKLY